jgi:hypothetical protein
MGFGKGSRKNRISCDFRFEIGIAARPLAYLGLEVVLFFLVGRFSMRFKEGYT